MTSSPLPARTLVHVSDPGRWDDDVEGADVLPARATAEALAEHLDDAVLLVVDDVLAFPFEAIRDVDWDIPLALRLPAPLDSAGLEAVLGRDVLDHLTPLDVVAGPSGAWGPVLTQRGLPRSRYVGGSELTVAQLVNRARQRRRLSDLQWRPRSTPKGAPLDVVNLPVAPERGAFRLRDAKARLRCELRVVRDVLEQVVARQPRTRPIQAVVLARSPEVWASALPPAVAEWTAVPLVAGDDHDDDLHTASARTVEVPDHLRLPLSPGGYDVAVVAADVLHSPTHSVARMFHEVTRLLRPGGSLVLLAEVVPDPRRAPERRPSPLSASAVLDVVATASGRQVVLDDLQAVQRPGEDHHRVGVFRWTFLGTARRGRTWM